MDYRSILKDKFNERRGRNSSYSLRAYARDLSLSPPRLTEILSGKKGLSEKSARIVVKALHLNPTEEAIFILSVESLHSRSAVSRKAAFEKLRIEIANLEKNPVKHSTVVHWTTEAVHKLLQRKGFIPKAANVSASLGIPLYLATNPLRFLTRAGLLPGTPSEKAYISDRLKNVRLNIDYEQILELAKKSFLKGKEPKLDHYDHAPLLIDPEDVEKAQKLIQKTYRELKQLESQKSESRLFYFSSQFFKAEYERKKQ